jgi:hypothetical protein
MPRHNVYFNLPSRQLENSDLIIEVFTEDEKFGTITISKGAIEWFPRKFKKPFRLSWEQFDKAIRRYSE